MSPIIVGLLNSYGGYDGHGSGTKLFMLKKFYALNMHESLVHMVFVEQHLVLPGSADYPVKAKEYLYRKDCYFTVLQEYVNSVQTSFWQDIDQKTTERLQEP